MKFRKEDIDLCKIRSEEEKREDKKAEFLKIFLNYKVQIMTKTREQYRNRP